MSLLRYDRHGARYKVWSPDHGSVEDDATEIEAADAEDAAKEWAERDDCNSADYLIVRGNDALVHVRAPDGSLHRFMVSGESVPVYRARALSEGDNAGR